MHHLSIDLETYSSVPIAKAGAQKYISCGCSRLWDTHARCLWHCTCGCSSAAYEHRTLEQRQRHQPHHRTAYVKGGHHAPSQYRP